MSFCQRGTEKGMCICVFVCVVYVCACAHARILLHEKEKVALTLDCYISEIFRQLR